MNKDTTFSYSHSMFSSFLLLFCHTHMKHLHITQLDSLPRGFSSQEYSSHISKSLRQKTIHFLIFTSTFNFILER